MIRLGHLAAPSAVVTLALGLAFPVQAGPTEVSFLSSYIGDWSGAGVLKGGEAPQPFTCRLSVDKGNRARINYAGRCTLTNMNLSVSGTIAYNDDAHHYEAVMNSNAGFTGIAVGRQQGSSITFDLVDREADRAGNDVRLGAQLALVASTSITVDYQVEFNNSGNVLTATVPFTK